MFDAGKLRFGRVVGYRWIVVAGSWGRSRLVDRYSRLWRYVGLTKGVSIRLLARTAGRTWARCCSGRTVRNSESLRGLCCTLQERRGRGKARALPGPLAVRTYRTGAKLCRVKAVRTMAMARFAPKPCGRIGRVRRLCRADEADGSEGFAVSKPCGRWLWLGSRQSRADVSDGSEGFVVSKPCGRADGSEGFVGSKPCGRIGRERRLLSCQSRADERTGAKALSCQSRADRPGGRG